MLFSSRAFSQQKENNNHEKETEIELEEKENSVVNVITCESIDINFYTKIIYIFV